MRGVVVAAIVVCAVGAAGVHAAPAVTDCGTTTVGPGTVVNPSAHGGARCLLAAYRDHCRAAHYRLSRFGVDTAATDDFRTLSSAGRCVVAVTISFRLIPRPPQQSGQGTCRTLRLIGTKVVAGSCTGRGLTPTISLT